MYHDCRSSGQDSYLLFFLMKVWSYATCLNLLGLSVQNTGHWRSTKSYNVGLRNVSCHTSEAGRGPTVRCFNVPTLNFRSLGIRCVICHRIAGARELRRTSRCFQTRDLHPPALKILNIVWTVIYLLKGETGEWRTSALKWSVFWSRMKNANIHLLTGLTDSLQRAVILKKLHVHLLTTFFI
jgi:hypothetical protein